jgi:hypothetical protein
VKNKKIEKLLVKLGVGAVFSALLGYTYKVGQYAEDKIDKKYDQKKDSEETS